MLAYTPRLSFVFFFSFLSARRSSFKPLFVPEAVALKWQGRSDVFSLFFSFFFTATVSKSDTRAKCLTVLAVSPTPDTLRLACLLRLDRQPRFPSPTRLPHSYQPQPGHCTTSCRMHHPPTPPHPHDTSATAGHAHPPQLEMALQLLHWWHMGRKNEEKKNPTVDRQRSSCRAETGQGHCLLLLVIRGLLDLQSLLFKWRWLPGWKKKKKKYPQKANMFIVCLLLYL